MLLELNPQVHVELSEIADPLFEVAKKGFVLKEKPTTDRGAMTPPN